MNEPPVEHASFGVRARRFALRHRVLLVILAVAVVAGFWSISARGSVFIDEAYQHLEGLWVKSKISYLLRHPGFGFSARHFALDTTPGLPPVNAKPLHTLLIAFAVRIFPGAGPTPVLIMENLFGLGTIVLVYAIADRVAGRRAAVVSAALLATSSMFLAYRRSGLPEMDSLFFFAAAVYVLVRAGETVTKRRALAIGVLAGCCFTANDRWYIALPVVLSMLVVLRTRRSSIIPALLIVAGFAIPPLFAQGISELPLMAARAAHVRIPGYSTYFARILARDRYVIDTLHAGPRLSQIPHAPYLTHLRSYEGWIWLIAVGALMVVALRRRRTHAVALIWAVLPFLLAAASPLTAPRYMSLTLPGIALSAGIGAASLKAANIGRALVALGMISSTLHIPAVIGIKAKWSQALAIADPGVIVSPKSYSLATYVGKERVVLGFQDSIAWAREQKRRGARWLILELYCPKGSREPSTECVTIFSKAGELSSYFLRTTRPLSSVHSLPLPFAYEGMTGKAKVLIPKQERFVLLYDLDMLPPA